MKKLGACLILALGLIVAVPLASAQEKAPAHRKAPQPKTVWKSAWTTVAPKSKGEPYGYVQYQDYCAVCHGAGAGKPGTLALQAKYKGKEPALLADRTDLTAPLIKTYVRNGDYVMPTFRKTEISDADLDAIAAYLTRNNKPKTH
jgi:mono/diheme cytochrome c family protein